MVKNNNVTQQPADFDWSAFEDGWNGSNLKRNKKVNTPKGTDRIKVYSHEKYAQDVFDAYMGKTLVATPKDCILNSIHYVNDITPVSNTEVIVDTVGGSSFRIDLNKEKEYITMMGCDSIDQFINSINKSSRFKKSLINTLPTVKVLDNSRVSLYAGHCAKIENEFHNQINNPTTAYYAHIDSINGGGYIVTIEGINAFLPGSLAQTNKILDYDALVGKTIPVMIDSYLPHQGFIVSYKKYLKTILPYKIETQLSVGMAIDAEVTGVRKNNVFLQFADLDNNEDMIFTGLLPYDNCCAEIKKDIENGQFKAGSKWRVYIYAINPDGNGGYRIVFCDRPLSEMEQELNEEKENTTNTEVVNNVPNNEIQLDNIVAKIG